MAIFQMIWRAPSGQSPIQRLRAGIIDEPLPGVVRATEHFADTEHGPKIA
jgi:hypothetical protein